MGNGIAPFELKAGQCLLYMKVGTHAQESLDHIIARKRKEIEDAGFAHFGDTEEHLLIPRRNGSAVCKRLRARGGTIYLCMEEMDSNHLACRSPPMNTSADGVVWDAHSSGNHSSGFAIRISNQGSATLGIRIAADDIRARSDRKSRGTIGAKYIAGRVDKACLEVTELPAPAAETRSVKKIGLVARIVDPYAVYLRNRS